MIREQVLRELSDIVGPRYILTPDNDLSEYARDAARLSSTPDAVLFPGNSEEISRILLLANREPFPVVPRGAGSGKCGGAVPVKGGIVLAMDRFDRILGIDTQNLVAKVEPGVITAHLQEEVEKRGLFYPPDPASIKISTIGGNVATCAGGLRAVKYGVTRDYVLGLEVVLPTGEIIKTGVETPKGVVGYDLTRLIVGSEGTLAVITSVTLRLIPKPAGKKTLVAFFADLPSVLDTVYKIIRAGIVPTTLEFMDRLCMDCAGSEMGSSFPVESQSLLLIEVDGDEALTVQVSGRVRDLCLGSGALHVESARSEEEAERLWEARRNISETLYVLGPDKISEDIVVPRSTMAEFVSFLQTTGKRYGLPVPCFGHAGDGNIHVNILFDEKDPKQSEGAKRVVGEIFEKVIKMRGTISGEHGIGITKAPYLGMEISPPALELMVRLKRAFDPEGILNPGKIFP
ncbi:MAG: FAD-binding protein [Deltaproteobacteria bacterium]|nr:FAD-binding protein [Deltaproteobacteria bacterium]